MLARLTKNIGRYTNETGRKILPSGGGLRAVHRRSSTAPLVKDAGRRGRRPLRNPIGKHLVGADAYIGPPYALLAMCHCETSDRCHWLWQSVPLAPLPKGGWHGEAVTGGYLTAPLVTLRRGDPCGRPPIAPPAGHTGPALQGVALSGPGGQSRPPLQPFS